MRYSLALTYNLVIFWCKNCAVKTGKSICVPGSRGLNVAFVMWMVYCDSLFSLSFALFLSVSSSFFLFFSSSETILKLCVSDPPPSAPVLLYRPLFYL